MAKTAAERQKAFKTRRREIGDGHRRVDMFLPTDAYCALKRLAAHHGESMAETIARMMIDEDYRIGRGMSEAEFTEYLKGSVTR